MTTDKKILDACCGNRMMWFDKADPDTIYMDIRDAEFIACDGRRVRIHPDLIAVFGICLLMTAVSNWWYSILRILTG